MGIKFSVLSSFRSEFLGFLDDPTPSTTETNGKYQSALLSDHSTRLTVNCRNLLYIKHPKKSWTSILMSASFLSGCYICIPDKIWTLHSWAIVISHTYHVQLLSPGMYSCKKWSLHLSQTLQNTCWHQISKMRITTCKHNFLPVHTLCPSVARIIQQFTDYFCNQQPVYTPWAVVKGTLD